MTDTRVVPRARLTIASACGIGALLLAAAVHAATFTSTPLRPGHPLFLLLHVGIFPFAGLMIWRLREWPRKSDGVLGFPKALSPYFPPGTNRLGLVLFVYFVANFVLSLFRLPAHHAGELTPEQARAMERMFSAGWLVVYTQLTFFFLFVPASALESPEP